MAKDAYHSTDFALTIPERIAAYFRTTTTSHEYHGFETFPLQQVEFVSCSVAQQQLVYRLKVPAALCNKDGNLHGGAASTLLDNLSATALYTVSKPGFWDNLGVSRSLYLIFHRAVPAESEVRVLCSVVMAGRKMATMRAEMWLEQEEGDVLCVTCVHDKVYNRTPKL